MVIINNMYPAQKEKIIHNEILEFLKKNPKGFTMSELVRGTKFSRKAIEKHLEVLILENEIYMKKFGITKVYYPNHRIHHFDFKKLDYNKKTIWFDILENEYGKYLLIQKKKINNSGEWVQEHSITIPLEKGKDFLKVLTEVLNSKRVKQLLKEDSDNS